MLSELSIIEFLIVQLSVAFSPGLIIALIINESVQTYQNIVPMMT